ncbi:hypothetical protein HRbin30_00302 [bacterium HR30]|nr:hypothetical protein HRbin30_00302 [bacterium HR30]
MQMMTNRAQGLGRRFFAEVSQAEASSHDSRNPPRRFDRAPGSGYSGNTGTHLSTQLSRMVCSSWLWLTRVVAHSTESVVLGVMTSKPRAVPNKAMETDDNKLRGSSPR